MSLSPREFIHHILDEVDYILTQIPQLDFDSFVRNPTVKSAFVRSLEIIGEAAKKLPDDVKLMQPDIEWRKVTGMRDRLIHDYFGVDYTIVWDVATTKLADLRSKLTKLLNAIEKSERYRRRNETLEAIEDIKTGRVADGEKVMNWLAGWGTGNELEPPI